MNKTKPKKSQAKPEVKPIRMSGKDAYTFLGIGSVTFWKLSKENVFTVIASPKGRGLGRSTFYHTDELELYAVTNDPEKVRAFRREKGRLK